MADPKRIAALHKQGGIYKPMSEITPGTQDLLDSPTPAWLDRDYPYVAPPGEDHTLQELDYLVSLIPLREKWASFIKAADEDMTPLFVTLCSELGAPCDVDALNEMASEASILITKLKWLYNRPRPYQVAAKHLRLSGQGGVFKKGDFSVMGTTSAHSPAYPSGHTIQAHLMASRLSETSPQHRKAFMDLAEKVSFSRAVAGYHWPSDLAFGQDIFRHIVMPLMPSAVRVAKTFTVNKGDLVWYGKYKNQRGKVKNFGMSDKGDPTVTVEQLPSPSARKPKKKSPKTMNLFKIRPRKKDEHDEAADKTAGGSRTLYHVGKRPAQPQPKRAEWRQRGQPEPDWVRPWLDAPVSKGVFLTPNPFLVAPKHGVFGHVYAYQVPNWVIKQAKGINRKDGVSEVLIPEPLWEHVKFKGKSMDREDFLNQVYRSEDAAFTGSRANKYRTKSDWEALRSTRLAASKALSKKKVPKADGSGTTTVYEYGPRQVAQRNKEKAVRIETLRKKMGDLRQKAQSDLTASDPETRLAALAVCLMDETYARVGNEKSAEEGHHGVTNWLADHVTLGDKAATIRYTGKSGVKQEKKITNSRVLAALRKALEGKGKGDKVLCDGDECSVLAKDVNAYLKPFSITAKDIRGLHANEEMKRHLRDQRKAGPDLPRSRKEKDKILKAEFKAALELASDAVGHKDSTLRSQYLVPSMEEAYVHDGTVLDRLDKKATLSDSEKEEREAERLVRQSPKLKPPRRDKERGRIKDTDPDTDPDEKQDRKDRSNNYKDAAVAKAMRKYLALTAGTARSKRRRKRQPSSREVARRKQQSDTAKGSKPKAPPKLKEAPAPGSGRKKPNVGDTWKPEGSDKWSAKSKDGTESGFASQEAAKAWLTGGPGPGASGDTATDSSPAADTAPKPPDKKPSAKGRLTRKQKREMVDALVADLAKGAAAVLSNLPEDLLKEVGDALGEPARAVVDALLGIGTEALQERATFARATLKRVPTSKRPTAEQVAAAETLVEEDEDGLESLQDQLDDLEGSAPDSSSEDSKAHKAKVTALKAKIKKIVAAEKTIQAAEEWANAPSPAEIAESLVALRSVEVRNDPLLLDLSNPITNLSTDPLNLEGGPQKQFMGEMGDLTVSTASEYRALSKKDRDSHRQGLADHMQALEDKGQTDTKQYHHTLAQMRGLQMASALEDGDDATGVSAEFQTFLKAAQSQGADVLDKFIKLNVTGAAEGDVDAQQQFRDVLRGVPPAELRTMVPQDNPAAETLDMITGAHLTGKRKELWLGSMDDETRQLLQEHAEDMIMDEIMFTDMDLVRAGKSVGQQKKKSGKQKKQTAERATRRGRRHKSVLDELRKKWAKMRNQTLHSLSSALFGTPPSTAKTSDLNALQAYDFHPWGTL